MPALSKIDSWLKTFILGHLIDFSRDIGVSSAGFDWRREQITTAGAHVIRFFSRPILMVYSPELVKFFTNLDAEFVEKSPKFKKIFTTIMTKGIIFQENLKWKMHRKVFEPFCHLEMVKSFSVNFNAAASDLVTFWRRKSESGESFFVDADLQALTLRTILSSLLGLELDMNDARSQELGAAFLIVSKSMTLQKSLYAIISRMPILWRLTSEGRNLQNAYATCSNFIKSIIDTSSIHKRQTDLAYYMFQTGNFTADEITANVFTFILAGHETNKSTLCWALHELGKRPELQEKLFEEIQSELTKGSTMDQMINKNWRLSSFLSETQRFYSVAPEIVPRILTKPVHLPNGTVAPKGTSFMIGIWESHMNPNSWHDPETFKPTRFLDEEVIPCSFIPFSTGPRKCLGYKYGLHQVKTVLIHLILNFKFTNDPGHQVNMTRIMTMNPHNGIKLLVKSR
jgi:cytochrome P450